MKFTKVIAMILAVAILCIGLIAPSLADSSYYEDQVKKYQTMKSKTVQIWIDNTGVFSRKTQKLWARQVTGVQWDGSFNLGPWECFENCSENFTLPGTYAVFGYSVDITWGTDWPYSGCFWGTNRIYDDELVDLIWIRLYGGCRDVGIHIQVNNRTVYQNRDCDSHSEWIPS